MQRYCKKYFYPEHQQNATECKKLNTQTGRCMQKAGFWCVDEVELTQAQALIMHNIRTIKMQNMEILFQLCGPRKTK